MKTGIDRHKVIRPMPQSRIGLRLTLSVLLVCASVSPSRAAGLPVLYRLAAPSAQGPVNINIIAFETGGAMDSIVFQVDEPVPVGVTVSLHQAYELTPGSEFDQNPWLAFTNTVTITGAINRVSGNYQGNDMPCRVTYAGQPVSGITVALTMIGRNEPLGYYTSDAFGEINLQQLFRNRRYLVGFSGLAMCDRYPEYYCYSDGISTTDWDNGNTKYCLIRKIDLSEPTDESGCWCTTNTASPTFVWTDLPESGTHSIMIYQGGSMMTNSWLLANSYNPNITLPAGFTYIAIVETYADTPPYDKIGYGRNDFRVETNCSSWCP